MRNHRNDFKNVKFVTVLWLSSEVNQQNWMMKIMKRRNAERLSASEISSWVLPNTEELLSMPSDELFARLNTSLSGLSSEEAEKRLRIYGYNELAKRKKRTAVVDFLSHFRSPLIIIVSCITD